MTSLYVLAVGIDAYDDSIGRLNGCRNDIDHAWAYLTDPKTAQQHVSGLRLYDEQATREAVIAGFRTHLAQATAGDTALFWFSGHGSFTPVPPELERLEPTGTMQTLLCVDSRRGNIPDLFDKELAVLIAEVASNGAHVAVVLDCCHASGANRDAPAALARWAAPLEAAPPIEQLLPELRVRAEGGRRGRPDDSRHVATAAPEPTDHVALFACATNERAYEVRLPTGARGAFSLALLTQLGRLGPHATYRELMTGARCYVESLFSQQVPVLFPSDEDIVDQPFLGGRSRSPASPTIMRFINGGWEIDAGACHGLAAGTPEDPTIVAVHGSDPIREARVDRVSPHRAVVRPIGWHPHRGEQYPVVLTSVPMPATTIAAHCAPAGHQPTLAYVMAALRTAAPGPRPSPHLREIAPDDRDEMPDLLLTTPCAGTVRVVGPDGTPAFADAYVSSANEAAALVSDLEHVARWRQVKALHNPASRLANAVHIEVVPRIGDEPSAPTGRAALRPDKSGAIILNYDHDGGRWAAPTVFMRLHNTAPRPLYCVLLDLTDRYRVHPHLFPGDLVRAQYSAWALSGEPIQMSLPPGRAIRPGASGTDWLKILVSETPFSSVPFALGRLDEPRTSASERPRGAFSGVVDRLGLAAMNRDADRMSPPAYDWTTSIITVITRVP